MAARLSEHHRILVSLFDSGTDTVYVSTCVFNANLEAPKRLIAARHTEYF